MQKGGERRLIEGGFTPKRLDIWYSEDKLRKEISNKPI